MGRFLCVCLGGAAGSGLRYLVALALPRPSPLAFPWATLLVNVFGCFLLELVLLSTALALRLSAEWRLALTTGFLGGFTTYSTFNAESSALFRSGAWRLAMLYAAVTVLAGFFAGLIGATVGRNLLSGQGG